MNAMILEVRATWTQIASTQMVLSSVSANQDLWAMDCVAKEVGLRLKYPWTIPFVETAGHVPTELYQCIINLNLTRCYIQMHFKQHQNSNAEIDLNNMIQYLTNNNIIDTDTQTLGTVKGCFYHMYNQLVNN